MTRAQAPWLQRRTVARFNATHAVGSVIRVWPWVMGEGPGTLVRIVAPGARMLGGTAVVQVSGGHGCIALSHVLTRVRRPSTPEERARAIAMRKAGEKLVVIAAVLRRPEATVSCWLRAAAPHGSWNARRAPTPQAAARIAA